MSLVSKEAMQNFWLPWLIVSGFSVAFFGLLPLYEQQGHVLFALNAILVGVSYVFVDRYGQARWRSLTAAAIITSMGFWFIAVMIVVGPSDHEICMHLLVSFVYGIPFGALHGTLFSNVMEWFVTRQ